MASIIRASFLLQAILSSLPLLTNAHMEMSWPYPIRSQLDPAVADADKDYSYTSPLLADGSNFPCKGYQNGVDADVVKAVYTAGGTYNMTLAGTVTHDGGSCQLSLSYDNGATFKVIESMIGGCPLVPKYDFTIPSFAPPSSSVLLAWSWFNLVGNREMYMDCARVEIQAPTGSRVKRSPQWKRQNSMDQLPDMFVCNVNNGCTSIEGQNVIFPYPGTNIIYGQDSITPSPGNGFTGSGFKGDQPPNGFNGTTSSSPSGSSGSYPTPPFLNGTASTNAIAAPSSTADNSSFIVPTTIFSTSSTFISLATLSSTNSDLGTLTTVTSGGSVTTSVSLFPTTSSNIAAPSSSSSISLTTLISTTSTLSTSVTITIGSSTTVSQSTRTTVVYATKTVTVTPSVGARSLSDQEPLMTSTMSSGINIMPISASVNSSSPCVDITSADTYTSHLSFSPFSTIFPPLTPSTFLTMFSSSPVVSSQSSSPSFSPPTVCLPGTLFCNTLDSFSTCVSASYSSSGANFVYMGRVAAGTQCINTPTGGQISRENDGPCTPNGQIFCKGANAFYMCDQGGLVDMGPVAPGTVCQNGQIQRRGEGLKVLRV